MKRYDIEVDNSATEEGILSIENNDDGEWCKWSDVKELIFDRDQCKLLLTKMMEYVNAEERKAKTLIKVVR